MGWLQSLGIGFEVVGLLVALYGLRARYREFAPEGRGAFDPTIQAARQTARRLVHWTSARIRSILRRPPKVEALAGVAHGTAGGSARLRGRVGFGVLPTGRSNKPALADLDRRTRELLERVSDVRDGLEDAAARIDADVEAVRVQLRVEAERLEEQTRRLAIGDVGLQYVGFAMIAVGLILQGIGAAAAGG